MVSSGSSAVELIQVSGRDATRGSSGTLRRLQRPPQPKVTAFRAEPIACRLGLLACGRRFSAEFVDRVGRCASTESQTTPRSAHTSAGDGRPSAAAADTGQQGAAAVTLVTLRVRARALAVDHD